MLTVAVVCALLGLAYASAGGLLGSAGVTCTGAEVVCVRPTLLWRLAVWRTLLVGVQTLTALRMVPVAANLLGRGLRPVTVLFVGCSGPCGFVSIAFTLLARRCGARVDPLQPVVGSGAAAAPRSRGWLVRRTGS